MCSSEVRTYLPDNGDSREEKTHTPDDFFVNVLKEHFQAEYQRIHKSPYCITDADGAKFRALQIHIGAHVRTSGEQAAIDELKRRITAYLEDLPAWMERGPRWSLALFVGAINAYGEQALRKRREGKRTKKSWRDGLRDDEDDPLKNW